MLLQVWKNYFYYDTEVLLYALQCKKANSSKVMHLISCFHTSLNETYFLPL